MHITLAHLRERSTSGDWVSFAVFEAKSTSGTDSGNSTFLSQLENKARAAGLKVDQSALAFLQNGRVQFYSNKHLVNYLSRSGVPQWTHKIDM